MRKRAKIEVNTGCVGMVTITQNDGTERHFLASHPLNWCEINEVDKDGKIIRPARQMLFPYGRLLMCHGDDDLARVIRRERAKMMKNMKEN